MNRMSMSYLFAANVVVWLGLGGYLAFLAGRSAGLERRVRQLERLNDA
jgi:CcmD family protein